MDAQAHVSFLCTGNAARSVMGAIMLAHHLPALRISSAGTHVVEGQPMSWRTKEALEAVGYAVPAHRSRQLYEADLADIDLLVGMASEHIRYVQRRHSSAADRTATLHHLALSLPPGDEPLRDRVLRLGLEDRGPDPTEDIVDPAGGQLDDYVVCAREIDGLVRLLVPRLAADVGATPAGLSPGPVREPRA